jgi:uncharacterized membrane protein YccC
MADGDIYRRGLLFHPASGAPERDELRQVQFYNNALAIVAGLGAATLSFRLLPPLSPALRTRRLLALTLRDLRRLVTCPAAWTVADWERRRYRRLAALPDGATRVQRAHLLAALLVGAEIIRLVRYCGTAEKGPVSARSAT